MAAAPKSIDGPRGARYFVASLLPFAAFAVEAQLRRLVRG